MLLLALLLIVIVTLCLGRYLLKRKFKPNEEYLHEIKEIGNIKRLSIITSIIIFIYCIIPSFNEKFVLLISLLYIVELIRNKYILNYLNNKNENTATRKYILYDLGLQVILTIVIISCYLFLIN